MFCVNAQRMKRIVLYAALALIAGLAFTNMYNSIVDVPNWQRDPPISIQQAHDYFATANPGNFFRMFSPMAQVLTLAGLILFWKRGRGFRIAWGAALILAVIADVLTFGYFYPRNAILFMNDTNGQTEAIRAAVDEWASMNRLRTFIVFVSFACAAVGLHRTYGTR